MNLHAADALCVRCGAQNVVLLPVPPLFSYDELCVLIPAKLSSLRTWTYKNKHLLDPPRYKGPRGKGRRLFTGEEVKLIRAHFVRGTR